jgi:hypothetical protein
MACLDHTIIKECHFASDRVGLQQRRPSTRVQIDKNPHSRAVVDLKRADIQRRSPISTFGTPSKIGKS